MTKKVIRIARLLGMLALAGAMVFCSKETELKEIYDTEWEPVEVYKVELRKGENEFVVDRNEITAPKQGITAEVIVNTQMSFSAKCPADWVTLTQKNNTLIVEVKPSEEAKARITMIEFVAEGEVKHRIDVTQIETELNYTLPFLGFGPDLQGIVSYERGRSAKYIRRDGNSDRLSYDRWDISNIDKNFREVSYVINNRTQTYTRALLLAKSKDVFNSSEQVKFEEYLLTQGFVKKRVKTIDYDKNSPEGSIHSAENADTPSFFGDDEKIFPATPPTTISESQLRQATVFINKEKQAVIEYMPIEGNIHYRLDYVPMQNKVNKTFNSLPTYERKTTKEEVMKEIEQENERWKIVYGKAKYKHRKSGSGEYKEGQIINYSLVYSYVDPKEDDPVYLEHLFYERDPSRGSFPPYHGRKGMALYYYNVELAIYKGLDGKEYITKEFKELLEKEGYHYQIGSRYNGHVFVNPDKGSVSVKVVQPMPKRPPMLRLQLY